MTAVLVILGVIALGFLVGWLMSKVIDAPYEDADIVTRNDTPVEIHLTDVYQPPIESAEDKRNRLYKEHTDELEGKDLVNGIPRKEYMRQWYIKNRKTIAANNRRRSAEKKAQALREELQAVKGQQAINTTPAIPTQQAYSPEFGYGAGVKD